MSCLPADYYDLAQNDVFDEKDYAQLMDAVFQLCLECEYRESTFYLSVDLIRRYLQICDVSVKYFSEVVIICVNIVAKYREANSMDFQECYEILSQDIQPGCASRITLEALADIESDILTSTDFVIGVSNIYDECCLVANYYRKTLSQKHSATIANRIVDDKLDLVLHLCRLLTTRVEIVHYHNTDIVANVFEFVAYYSANTCKRWRTHAHDNLWWAFIINTWQSQIHIAPHIQNKAGLHKTPPSGSFPDCVPLSKSIAVLHRKLPVYTIVSVDYATILGSGTYGKIYATGLNANCVVKRISHRNYKLHGLDANLVREISHLHLLHHPAIVKLYGVYYDENATYIQMERMQCDLYHFMNRTAVTDLEPSRRRNYVRQLLHGISFMHSQQVMHRDLSASNILISGLELKIADFGLSRCFSDSDTGMDYSENVCTFWFRAPELFCDNIGYNQKIDVWSAGCLSGYILGGKILFRKREADMLNTILRKVGTHRLLNLESDVFQWKVGGDYAIKHPHQMAGTNTNAFRKLRQNYPNEMTVIRDMLCIDPKFRCSSIKAYQQFQILTSGN